MNFSAFHLSQQVWLWGLMAIPCLALLYVLFYKSTVMHDRLKLFADAHLLPHLLKNRKTVKKSILAPLVLLSLIWGCGALAMAGPVWDYTDIEANKPESDLVILLDLSKSMDAQDVNPSRLVRAREEIEDILNMNRKLNIGLVAFAAVPHMVVPLTEDMSTIRNLLPYLDTRIVYLQGTRLKPALDMATRMLNNAPGNNKSILVVSDGGFEDTAAARNAIGKNITVYSLGIGTAQGAPIPADDGGFIKDRAGNVVIARLEEGKLKAIAEAWRGMYVAADYTGNDTRALLKHMEGGGDTRQGTGKTVRVWDEKFWIPALAMGLLMLPLFRKGRLLPVLLFFALAATPLQPAQADWTDIFRNHNQQGAQAFDKGDYGAAVSMFDTPYQRGVAQYKAKQYEEAAKSFGEVKNPQRRLDAKYNLGNAQLMSNKPDAAIANYEAYLKERPNDKPAQHNLAVARKLLAEQQNQQPKNQQQNSQQTQTQKNSNQNGNTQQTANGQKPDEKSGAQANENQLKKEGQGQQQSASGGAEKQQQPNAGNKGQPAQQQPQQTQNPQAGLQIQQQPQQSRQRTGQSSQGAAAQNQTPEEQQEQTKTKTSQQSQTPLQPRTQGASQPPSGENDNFSAQTRPRTQQDIDADQWLDRAESNPGAFLKNQFLIEARKSGAQQEDEPW